MLSASGPFRLPGFARVYGVDFSGARLAGRATWVARLDLGTVGAGARPRLVALDRLDRLAGTAERAPALAHLVALVRASADALWAFDCPFGLPVELLPPRAGWGAQRGLVREWGEDAYGLGLECVRRARALGGPLHVRRLTDGEARAPFDPYHYRIIYQTFYGMRDVAGPLAGDAGTAVLPFQYRKLGRRGGAGRARGAPADERPAVRRVVVETCPGSTLKRWGLPHQRYKQPEGGALTAVRRRTRRAIVGGLCARVAVDAGFVRRMMRDPGGDALDAVVAAIGGWEGVCAAEHAAGGRYGREGRLFY
ncbi:hypothetical protein tb265_08950 [Gemmatimonadetes bacterium T265]|nr:hypothetical protein tb265_08950 [Gemmatimonadetes bacterium T265]